MGLRRWAGYTNIAAACPRRVAQPQAVLHRIGIAREDCMGSNIERRIVEVATGRLRRPVVVLGIDGA